MGEEPTAVKPARYSTYQDEALLAGMKPDKNEYYGPCWEIFPPGAGVFGSVVIIPDPGDGSAAPLARKILALFNSGELP